MQVNRGFAFWGVALITAGAVALAMQAQLLSEESTRQAWRLWPVVLVVIGLAIIASRTPLALLATVLAGLVVGGLAGTLVAGAPDGLSIGCGGEATETASADGTFESERAQVMLDFSCGDLAVSTTDATDWSVDARHGSDREPRISSDGDSLRVNVEGGGFPGFSEGRQEWDVVLPTGITLDLTVDANASSSRLDLAGADLSGLALDANAGDVHIDLAGASVADLAIDANAGSLSIVADGSTTLAGSVEMNAGSLDVCAPDDVGVAITIEDANVTFSHNLDELGLSRQGNTWSTGGGAPAIELDVDGNAASFSLNPERGCA